MPATTIEITRTTTPRPRPAESELGFGKYFADHMLVLRYAAPKGWEEPKIVPYGPLALDPAASCLHYGQAMFEGMKAFRQADGRVALFRLGDHARRLSAGAPRLSMPAVDPALFQDALSALISTDKDWVPSSPGTALYLRPVLIGTEPFLGVRPSSQYLLYVITCPVGAYYAGGLKPVKIWVELDAVRAVRGGIGAVKAAANYVASLKAAEDARARGYEQVLWLDALSHQFVEEVGTMNLFVQIGDELLTPSLEGTILSGITRDSVLQLARDWGLRVTERPIGFAEILEAQKAGTLREVFGSGTAAVISSVGELGYSDGRLTVNGGEPGPLATRLYKAISDIQRGNAPDAHNWMTPVD